MSRRKHCSRPNRKKLRLEDLERRELLAADFMPTNAIESTDVNNDVVTSPRDALMTLGALNTENLTLEEGATDLIMDANGDGALTARDALQVVGQSSAQAEDRPGRNGPRRGPGGDEGRGDPEEGNGPNEGIAAALTVADGPVSFDGSGNNLESPDWGSVGQPLERIAAVEYADGVSEPAGEDRLSARAISNIAAATPGDIANSKGLSDLTWLFGQFIDHDIALSEGGDEPLSIEVPAGDPHFDPFGTGTATIDTHRTHVLGDTEVRTQFNEISAFIDGSVIYGSDQERADALRSFEGGRLATSDGNLLPFNEPGLLNAGGDSADLFLAGDIRANENAGLASMHTLWVREHNRVADEIAEDNPNLNDEEIYHEARQLVTATLQSITYNEFLPALLGDDAVPDYEGYDPTVNPNIANEFSTAAYRFGHTMLSPELLRLNNDGSVIDAGNISLQDAFFNVGAVVDNDIDSLLLGGSVQTAQEVDPFVVDDVRNFLFGPPGAGGLDLASLNIARGRDHGLADYNQLRVDIGLDAVQSFADISSSPEIQARLAKAYTDVNSIDPWVGMLAEDHVGGSTLGVTATTIIANQFTALRDGDRFYYENVFDGRQLNQIENDTLGDVIERNTTVDFDGNTNVFFASNDGIDDGGDGPDGGGGNDGGPSGRGGRRRGRRGGGGGNGGGPGGGGGGGQVAAPTANAATDEVFALLAGINEVDDLNDEDDGRG